MEHIAKNSKIVWPGIEVVKDSSLTNGCLSLSRCQ